jgi:hypothetical protein
MISASLSGSLSTSNSSLSGFAGLQNLGNGNMAATSMSPGVTNGTSGMDALSQAYTGIQQYAGLSGLLSPATGKWLIFTTIVNCLVLLVCGWVDGKICLLVLV